MGENNSSLRYVHKVNANPEMSHGKLMSRMQPGSTVLEFGPASGAMTSVMSQEMGCHVSIVELDSDCYAQSMQYAEDGFLGNIEDYTWEEHFAGKQFDYVVLADVLEHLLHPQTLLEHVNRFLVDDGAVLISVPNIAHNSIIIQLLKNQLVYQSTGIMDHTHVHWFTYSELQQTGERAGYGVTYLDAVYIAVGKNEFQETYGELDPVIASYLKRRPLGEVYQHIVELRKADYVKAQNLKIDNCLGEPAAYTDAVIEALEGENSSDLRTELLHLLKENPNVFFENNNEIARVRTELNDLYQASEVSANGMPLVQRLNDLQNEIMEKNRYAGRLQRDLDARDARIVELQDSEQQRNEHIAKLDEEVAGLIQERQALSEQLESTQQLHNDRLARLDDQIASLTQERQNLYEQLQRKDESQQEMKSVLDKRELSLNEFQAALIEREVLVNERWKETIDRSVSNDEKASELEKLRTELDGREAEWQYQTDRKFEWIMSENDRKVAEVRAEADQQIAALQADQQGWQQERAQMMQEIRNRDGHIDQLLETEREFERYKNTAGYRSTIRRRKIIDFLLPPNSKRLFILHVIKQIFTQPRLMAKVIQPSNIGNYIKYLKSDSIEEITSRYNEIQAVAKEEIGIAPTEPAVADTLAVNVEELHIEDYPMLIMSASEQPLVSIVIPVYNQFDYTYKCLQSIQQNSGTVPYEILIANDCSTDITTEIERVVKNIRVITTEHNVRFLLNCNNAAEYAKGTYILFLNNDTQVKENWLQPLVDTMDQYADCGMVGSKLIYPDGRLQEAGGIVWKDASAWNYGHLKNPDDPEFTYLKEADYVSGAAIMIRTSLWKEIGGFDERFVPAYYEDTDLAFEVRRHGYKVLMQPQSVVVHFEGVSNGTDTSTGLKAYQVANCEKFLEKWRDVLEKEHFPNAQDVYLAKDRGQLRTQILVVDHYVPNYDKDAGGRCTYMYIKMFLQMGMKVTFIGDNFAHPEPYTTELNSLGVEILYGNYYYNNWKEWLKDNLHYFDYVYLQRPHISIKYIDIVKKYARGKIFYFAHDLHHVRMMRDYELTGDVKALDEAKKWKKIEMELFEKADVCHVVGSYEQGVMQKVFPDKPIRNIPLYIYDDLPDVEKDFSKRQDLLFVGGFGHTPNIDAVMWFATEVYPKVLAKYPDMVWHIVGSKAPQEVLDLASPNIVLEGFVSDEDLAVLYQKCRMTVVPLRYGAGVKGKVVESAYYQIPLVTTPIGGEGLDATFGCFVMDEDPDEMAERICSLYEDYDRLREMSDAGREFIGTYFTPEVARAVLEQDL